MTLVLFLFHHSSRDAKACNSESPNLASVGGVIEKET